MDVPGPEVDGVDVDGRRVKLTNLAKVLYPAVGFTKGEVIDHYRRVAPALVRYVADRPITLKRYPDGVDGPHFFEKHAPRGTPGWVRHLDVTVGEGKTVDAILGTDAATLVWMANLASLELHAPMWRYPDIGTPDVLVFDLDPGEPATAVECCAVALRLRDRLVDAGLVPVAKSSGKKGVHVLAGIEGVSSDEATGFARNLAAELTEETPDAVVMRMARAERTGKVFVDWSQNRAGKTTVAPYSLRATPEPRVSMPLTWDEIAACRTPEDVWVSPATCAERLDTLGDLCEPLSSRRGHLPG